MQALLAARLDQLEAAERAVLKRGSVEGRIFHRGAALALAEGDVQIDQPLLALVRKELVRPVRPQFQGDDAYRFRHLLIRDAAYDALTKATTGAPCTAGSLAGSKSTETRSSSWTRSSATTSNRPPATDRSSDAPTASSEASRRAPSRLRPACP